MKSFKQFLREAKADAANPIVVTFGRFNPPTTGHGKLLDSVAATASKESASKYRIYASHGEDKKKNPLSYKSKVLFMRKMFPKHSRAIVIDSSRNALEVLGKLYDEGFNEVVFVVGSDRVTDFSQLLNKYNGVKTQGGYYEFNSIRVVSAGERDPDSDDVAGMSASKMRAAAGDNDLSTFMKGVPTKELALSLFKATRKGMGLKESVYKVIEPTLNELRQLYIEGKIFTVGSGVLIKECQSVGKIAERGPNFVVVTSSSFDKPKRLWLKDVTTLTE
jgi:hypothetical protein